jgi:hypothetical protein
MVMASLQIFFPVCHAMGSIYIKAGFRVKQMLLLPYFYGPIQSAQNRNRADLQKIPLHV